MNILEKQKLIEEINNEAQRIVEVVSDMSNGNLSLCYQSHCDKITFSLWVYLESAKSIDKTRTIKNVDFIVDSRLDEELVQKTIDMIFKTINKGDENVSI